MLDCIKNALVTNFELISCQNHKSHEVKSFNIGEKRPMKY